MKFSEGSHSRRESGRLPYCTPQSGTPKKVDVDPNEKIEGFLSAAALKAKEKKEGADGEKISPAKAKALIAQYTAAVHAGMYSSIVYPINSTVLLVAETLFKMTSSAFLLWIASMFVLVAITLMHKLETAATTISLLMIGFIMYHISAPPIAGNQQIGMMVNHEV